jgi:hypothetical protein
MRVREIPADEWQLFLDEFSRSHRAWLATVDRAHPGEEAHVEAVERPLGSVRPQVNARRVVRIEIRFQEDGQASTPIRIDAPASVRVEETLAGAARALEIRDEEGDCTRIRFRAAPLPEMLDGLAPGEFSAET